MQSSNSTGAFMTSVPIERQPTFKPQKTIVESYADRNYVPAEKSDREREKLTIEEVSLCSLKKMRLEKIESVEKELLKQRKKKRSSPKPSKSKDNKPKKKDELKVEHPGKSIALRYLVNPKDSVTLMDYSQVEIQRKIDRLYPKKPVIQTENNKVGKSVVDPEERKRLDKIEEDKLKRHREQINKRIRELEKEKPFVSELELKEVKKFDSATTYCVETSSRFASIQA